MHFFIFFLRDPCGCSGVHLNLCQRFSNLSIIMLVDICIMTWGSQSIGRYLVQHCACFWYVWDHNTKIIPIITSDIASVLLRLVGLLYYLSPYTQLVCLTYFWQSMYRFQYVNKILMLYQGRSQQINRSKSLIGFSKV